MHYQSWTSNTLFGGFSDEQLQTIEQYLIEKEFDQNQVIMKEGDPGDYMFIIVDGSVSVFKNELKLADILAGNFVGLMSLIDSNPRSATVMAGEKGAHGFIIHKDGFQQIMKGEKPSIVSTLLLNYIKYQQNSLRNTNDLSWQEAKARLEQEKKRVLSANFFVQMVLGLVIFTFLLGFLKEKTKQVDSTYISFVIMGIYGIWSYFYVRHSGLPLESFGLNMKNFKSSFNMIMKATLVFVVLLFILKFLMITFFPEYFGSQFIEFYESEGGGLASTLGIVILYCMHSVFQEFIARGCIQGGLLQFIIGKRAVWTAIILATLMFSSFHLMLNVQFAFITIIPGLFWGYLFYREKNILAVSISHMLIGVVAIFMLNILK